VISFLGYLNRTIALGVWGFSGVLEGRRALVLSEPSAVAWHLRDSMLYMQPHYPPPGALSSNLFLPSDERSAWGCSSVVEHLLRMCEVLDSITVLQKKSKESEAQRKETFL
jgi:hypothetical protein